MNKTTYTPNAPNILGCTCGFGLWLNVKVGDKVLLDWYDSLGYVEVVRLTNTQIVIRAENGNEYRFYKKNGEIAHADYNSILYGKPRISVRTFGTDVRLAAHKERKRLAMIDDIRAVNLYALLPEQLERIVGIINEVTE